MSERLSLARSLACIGEALKDEPDPDWQPVEMPTVGSMWGHQGLFEALGDPDMPAQKQRHAPLQVIDGNYQKMTGVCPWWDAMRRK